MFQQLTTSSTLVAGLVAVDVISTSIAVVSYTCLHRASSASELMDHAYLPSVRELESIEAALGEARATARGLFMHAVAGNTASAEATKRELAHQLGRIREHIAAYEHLASTTEELASWAEFVAAWNEWHILVERYMAHLEASDLKAAYDIVFGPGHDELVRIDDALESCIMLNMAYSHAASDRAGASQRFADFSVGVASVASLAMAVGIAVIARTGADPVEAILRSVPGFLP